MFNKYFQNKNFPFWIFTISILILLTVPVLIQDGMFLDAMLYTSVSHNLSHGIGSFRSLQFNQSGLFHEHPPLVFGIQSLFFRLLGDSMYVERFYTFLTMCTTAFLINILWRDLFKNEKEIREISWLPVLFWITIPASIWSYSNNMMENTMTIFDLCAAILIIRAAESGLIEPGRLLPAGVFIFLATFSKGVPGLFPLAIPFLHWLIYRKKPFGKVILSTAILICVPLLIYLVMFSFPQSRESLEYYVTKRLLARISDSPVVTNRLYILKRLLTELIPQILFLLIVLATAIIKKTRRPLISYPDRSAFFILTGLSASLPLTFTFVQRGFYLVPSFPFFAIGLSVLLAARASVFRAGLINNKTVFKRFALISAILFVLSIGYSLMQKGKTQRDKDMLHDVHAIGNVIPGKSAITISQDIAATCVLECYFVRYYNISLFVEEPEDYLLVKKPDKPANPDDFERLNIDTKMYDIYRRNKNK